MGPPIPRVNPPVNELEQSLLRGQGVVRVDCAWPGPADGSATTRDIAVRRPSARATWHGSAGPPGDSIYSVVKDPRRSKRQGRDEPRAQEAGARVYGSAVGVSPQAAYSGEARAPESIIQEGKKGIPNFMIVFMEIQLVTEFPEET